MATPETELGLYLNVGTIAAMIGAVTAGVWKLARLGREISDKAAERDEAIRLEIEAQIENVERDVKNLERENLNRADTVRHETGEMGAAIRQKIHDVEVFARDTFVSKASFEVAMRRIEDKFDKLGDRVESKIDRLINGR